jgi:hypothetical protein
MITIKKSTLQIDLREEKTVERVTTRFDIWRANDTVLKWESQWSWLSLSQCRMRSVDEFQCLVVSLYTVRGNAWSGHVIHLWMYKSAGLTALGQWSSWYQTGMSCAGKDFMITRASSQSSGLAIIGVQNLTSLQKNPSSNPKLALVSNW